MTKTNYYNVKVTVYLDRKLEDKIIECSNKINKGFSGTIRYLIEKGLNGE